MYDRSSRHALTISVSLAKPFCRSIIPNLSFEFHIRSEAREKYHVAEALFTTSGNVIFPNYRAVREFAHAMDQVRKTGHEPEQQIRAGHLNAMGLIDEIHHFIVRFYETNYNTGVFHRAYVFLEQQFGERLEECLVQFISECPPLDVYRRTKTVKEYFNGTTADKPNKEIVLEELMMLHLENFNPAFSPYRELFDDSGLHGTTRYAEILKSVETFFRQELPFGPDNQFLIDFLKAPILANPSSLEDQLKFIRNKWGIYLSRKYLDKLLGGMDIFSEEAKYIFDQKHRGGPAADVETFVPEYKYSSDKGKSKFDIYEEPERFTRDIDWMPHVVLLAKNTYVWLSQLSKKYQRPIHRLDQIPDEELDLLTRWNFTGLWLIGIWERSTASQKIKQWTGNPEAVPSAYSLFEYEIARDLGGEEAYQNLHHRAWIRGLRLAGDMVPNHMGIFSKWIIEHPEFFIQNPYPPYPNYRFTGGNLSDHPDIELRIEDGYWSRTDAAVVFQRIDKRTGSTTYIYHGNDGTSMPWNDTAQLNMLRADVREAVIQQIFHVARKFSIIRFDAAMTLAKKHFQRLWYPLPGTGSGIPSRADNAMTREDFDQFFPNEFWREVVDRINHEMPHTLLLAEAFWLMEGYFVRTLGMHRVYNSAFMHMLMREENSKYRALIKNTLEFNPEILKRYVNFMSNPDEQTAVGQFGKDDKYFGVALMMVTLPGLPMLAHGQVEGYTEKYGMEYKRAYYDESPDDYLLRRHEHEIFPIMRKRHLFSQVGEFEFYDFHDVRGGVNENVFAYSNLAGHERALVFFHNKYQECSGWINGSVPKSRGGENESNISSKNLGDALRIRNDDKTFYLFRDYKSDLEYIRSGRELHEKGIYVELKAFQYHIFLDFREVFDEVGEYEILAKHLNGNGVSDLHHQLKEIKLQPLHSALRDMLAVPVTRSLAKLFGKKKRKDSEVDEIIRSASNLCRNWITEVQRYEHLSINVEQKIGKFERDLKILYEFNSTSSAKGRLRAILQEYENLNAFHNENLHHAMLVYFLSTMIYQGHEGRVVTKGSPYETPFERWILDPVIDQIFQSVDRIWDQRQDDLNLVKLLYRHRTFFTDRKKDDLERLENLLNDFIGADYLNVNLHNGIWYYSKERFENILNWLGTVAIVDTLQTHPSVESFVESCGEFLRDVIHQIIRLKKISEDAQYQVEKLKEFLINNTAL